MISDFQFMVSPVDGSIQVFDPLRVSTAPTDAELASHLRMLNTWIARLDSIAAANQR